MDVGIHAAFVEFTCVPYGHFPVALTARYGARHLVTATLDSGQIGGGFFFLEYPSGAPQANFFDLKDVFTWFLHNFEVHISGNYYMLHFH